MPLGDLAKLSDLCAGFGGRVEEREGGILDATPCLVPTFRHGAHPAGETRVLVRGLFLHPFSLESGKRPVPHVTAVPSTGKGQMLEALINSLDSERSSTRRSESGLQSGTASMTDGAPLSMQVELLSLPSLMLMLSQRHRRGPMHSLTIFWSFLIKTVSLLPTP